MKRFIYSVAIMLVTLILSSAAYAQRGGDGAFCRSGKTHWFSDDKVRGTVEFAISISCETKKVIVRAAVSSLTFTVGTSYDKSGYESQVSGYVRDVTDVVTIKNDGTNKFVLDLTQYTVPNEVFFIEAAQLSRFLGETFYQLGTTMTGIYYTD